MRKKICVVFGGNSAEHDISILTAVQAMRALDTKKYEVFPLYIKDGFFTGELFSVADFTPFVAKNAVELVLLDGTFFERRKFGLRERFKPDVALFCTHGGEGENGVLQAVFEFNRIPYTSTDVLTSAVGMDKIYQKQLFSEMLLNVVRFAPLDRTEFLLDSEKTCRHIETFFDYPVIVKPARQGSSIGIAVANNRAELESALQVAAAFDFKIIVEKALTDFTEVNCAALKKDGKIVVSETEQPVNWQSFLSFDDKYIGTKNVGENKHIMPAPVGELSDEIKAITKRIYCELGLSGVVRIDFMIDNTDRKVYVNEINTIPGSLAFYLFEPLGISFSDLLDALIADAIEKKVEADKNMTTFDSTVLESFASRGKGQKGGKIR